MPLEDWLEIEDGEWAKQNVSQISVVGFSVNITK